MVRHATALVAYKEYPHVDIPRRADDLFRIVADAALGKTRPVMAAFACRMIGTYRTTEQPLRGFVDRMLEREGRDGIISISLGHGFPWGDVADVGAKTLVVADGDAVKAERLARALGEEFFAMREAVTARFLTMDEAIDRALAIDGGPVVIADVSDNAGGGAPGDATFFLQRLLDRGIGNAASGYYWDPMAVRACMEAGIGARFALRIGGKCGIASGAPVDLTVTVRGLAEGVTQRFGDAPVNMGETAWAEAGGIDLVLTGLRTQVFHPEGMTKLGLDVAARKLVVVKSTQHFHAGFAPIARAVLYAAPPGALRSEAAQQGAVRGVKRPAASLSSRDREADPRRLDAAVREVHPAASRDRNPTGAGRAAAQGGEDELETRRDGVGVGDHHDRRGLRRGAACRRS